MSTTALVKAKPTDHHAVLRSIASGSGLFGRFGYLLGTQGVLLIGGLGYWVLTTHTIAADQIGITNATISTAALLTGLGILGISSLLLVEIGQRLRSIARVALSTGALIAGGLVVVLALAVVGLAGVLGPSLRAMASSGLDPVLFVLGALTTTVGGVADAAAIGLRRAPAQLVRNLVQTIARLGLSAAAISIGWHSAQALLGAWVLSSSLSLVLVPWLLKLERTPIETRRVGARAVLVKEFGPLALRHYVLNVAITSVTFFLPFIAALEAASRDYAYFSVAQLLASSVLLPPALLAMTLFAETTGDERALRIQIRKTLPVGLGLGALVVAIFAPAAHPVLSLFGASYAAHGVTTLRLLLIGGLPYVIKDHYVAIRRAQQRLTDAARVVALATVLEVLGASVGGALGGIEGLCGGWAIATTVEAFGFAPAVLHVVAAGRRRDSMAVAFEETP